MTTEEELVRVSRELGVLLDKQMPKGVGFMLMVFDFGQKGNLAYISNGVREDVVRVLQEFIAKQRN
jgi:hypothetical protein